MVQIFRASEAEEVDKKGYNARYVADVEFRNKLNTGGFILVTVGAGSRTEPHKHGKLEEIFVALTDLKMHIDSTEYELMKGDVVLVAPFESHSFVASDENPACLLAIKFPNLKSDKISTGN
jgi:quercetin dioxygenase-like cupin family protein